MKTRKNIKFLFITFFWASLAFFWSPALMAVEGWQVEIFPQKGHTGNVYSLSLSPDGRYMVSGSGDNSVKLWDLKTGREIKTFSGFSNTVDSTSFHPNGKFIAAGTYNDVKIWNVYTEREVFSTQKYSSPVVYSPSGKYLLATDADRTTFRLLDMDTDKEYVGVPLKLRGRHKKKITCAAFSPDGRYIATGSSDRTVKLWDISLKKEICTFTGHTQWVPTVVFSPDGTRIVSGSKDGTIKLWDVNSRKEIQTFHAHSVVRSVHFSPRGNFILSGAGGGTTRLWDISTGKEICRFIESQDGEWVILTPEGYYKSSANGDKHLNVRKGNMEVTSIDNYRRRFHKPSVVESRLPSEAKAAKPVSKEKKEYHRETEKPMKTIAFRVNIQTYLTFIFILVNLGILIFWFANSGKKKPDTALFMLGILLLLYGVFHVFLFNLNVLKYMPIKLESLTLLKKVFLYYIFTLLDCLLVWLGLTLILKHKELKGKRFLGIFPLFYVLLRMFMPFLMGGYVSFVMLLPVILAVVMIFYHMYKKKNRAISTSPRVSEIQAEPALEVESPPEPVPAEAEQRPPDKIPACQKAVLTLHSSHVPRLKQLGTAFSSGLWGKILNPGDRLVFENILVAVTLLEPEGPVKITDETNVNIRSTEEPVILRCKHCGEHQEKIQKNCSACGRELHYKTL